MSLDSVFCNYNYAKVAIDKFFDDVCLGADDTVRKLRADIHELLLTAMEIYFDRSE